MDENVNDQDVLLVKEKDSEKLQAVAGADDKGNLKTVSPKQENEPDFLKIDKHGNVLENFFSNLSRQHKDPTHFQFFKAPLNLVEKVSVALGEMFKNPETPSNKEMLDTHRVDPADFEAKKSYKIDESRIDWSQFERLGVSRETLEKSGSLEAMLSWQKSPVLIPIVAKFDDTTLRTDARLSFRETPDGKLSIGIHALRREPELDRPYFGVKFTDEDKQNLLKTGNLGRVANAEYKQGEQIPVYLSVDKLTNELVALRSDRIKIPNEIKGVKLDETQKRFLADGKAIYLEGMIAKSGKEFSATIQVNADKKGIEFQFADSPKQSNDRNQSQSKSQSEKPEYFIPKKLGGVELKDEQQAKLKEGGTIYVEGMKDKEGKSFNAYVKFNFEEGKPKFYKWNPDKTKEVTPDNAAKTQVAVNSDGKTNEATKNVKEPLENGQTKPTEQQKAKEEQKQEEPKKSRGHKM